MLSTSLAFYIFNEHTQLNELNNLTYRLMDQLQFDDLKCYSTEIQIEYCQLLGFW